MIENYFWNLFEATGSIDMYLMYKKFGDKEHIKDGKKFEEREMVLQKKAK